MTALWSERFLFFRTFSSVGSYTLMVCPTTSSITGRCQPRRIPDQWEPEQQSHGDGIFLAVVYVDTPDQWFRSCAEPLKIAILISWRHESLEAF